MSKSIRSKNMYLGWSGGNMGPRPLGPRKIDGLHVPPGKSSTLQTDHLISS